MAERCLITGANGFIGRGLRQELQQRGFEVTAVPREILMDFHRLQGFVREVSPNLIFHQAAFGNKHNQIDDIEIIKANIMGTLNMLYASYDTPYRAFINTGSSSEYGTKNRPMKEDDPLDSDSLYGVTKASATLLCRAFAKKYDKPVVTVRPFSVYGPGDDPKKFIQTAIRCFQTDNQLNVAPGVHDWIYIDDYIEAILLVSEHAKDLQGQAINIGTGTQTSNHGVIAILKEIFCKPGKVKHAAKMRDYDTSKSWVADISKLKSLGWHSNFDLERGLWRCVYGDRES